MKKKTILSLFLCLALITAAAGCGSNNGTGGRASGQQKGVEEVLQEGMAEADAAAPDAAAPDAAASSVETAPSGEEARQSGLTDNAPAPEADASSGTVLSTTERIDIDLTSLTSTMVYSEVYNMMYEPDSYIGKTVKMDGLYAVYHDENTGNNYFACIIQDATACCAQGMEFVLTEEYSYPEDYPEEGTNIVVTGTFDTYMEGEYQYCTLREAHLN